MRRLTRTDVANAIGKHPSTVSRAVASKYVLLPSGRVMPFAKFFSPGAAPKTVIAEVLAREDPAHPLTDEQIRRILRIRGFEVARRTVAKYRLALRLPSSMQRGVR
jgi:RNA polymerase sigma-54 factor